MSEVEGVSNPQWSLEPTYVADEQMERMYARRTGAVAEFLLPYLQSGMRLIDCGCGPGSITVDLAEVIAAGEVVGIDLRDEALVRARELARNRKISNVEFRQASVYHLPYPDASFDAAFACAVIQHLTSPIEALVEIRRVLNSTGVIGVVDGSSPIVFRYPTSPLLEAWDRLRVLERERRTGRQSTALELRALLRQAGFARTQAGGRLYSEAGPPAGTRPATRTVAEQDLLLLRGVRGKRYVAEGLVTESELEQMAEALLAWGDVADAVFARPVFTALGWVSAVV
jgi:ubiquinone/menaquinone biosynthesis C-methylase UbiE